MKVQIILLTNLFLVPKDNNCATKIKIRERVDAIWGPDIHFKRDSEGRRGIVVLSTCVLYIDRDILVKFVLITTIYLVKNPLG